MPQAALAGMPAQLIWEHGSSVSATQFFGEGMLGSGSPKPCHGFVVEGLMQQLVRREVLVGQEQSPPRVALTYLKRDLLKHRDRQFHMKTLGARPMPLLQTA